jgi:hypothetical protein
MKRTLAVVPIVLGAILFSSCGKNPLAPAAMLSFYSGHNSSNAAPALFPVNKVLEQYGSSVLSAKIYIDKIEISRTGTNWETVLNNGPFQITITTETAPIRIGTPVNLPEGQYEGVRIYFESKIDITFLDGTTKEILKLPDGVTLNRKIVVQNTNVLTLSTADGTLPSFIIARGNETYLVLDIYIHFNGKPQSSIDSWFMWLNINPTRFLS